jgi:Arm DNA-binding domain
VGYRPNSVFLQELESTALSDTAVRAIKPVDKPFKIHYRGGLFLMVNPNGSKLWRWRYRFDGKEKLMALGEYPVVSLAAARERYFAARCLRPASFGSGCFASLRAQVH